MTAPAQTAAVSIRGRYAVYDEIAAGGMATVHYGRLLGPAGFSRTVAIKRLHAHFAKDPELCSMLLDEGRMAARIRHHNVVSSLEVVQSDNELLLVMDYVHGESLAKLVKLVKDRRERIPPEIVVAILSGVLHGLHAAHEATNVNGEPMGLVHRDVSPQNVLVGSDGLARVVDFGVAKAIGRATTTRDGSLRGKLPYMAPEQLGGAPVTRQSDVWGAAVVLWETLTLERLFRADAEAAVIGKVLHDRLKRPSTRVTGLQLPAALEEVVMRGLDRDPTVRYATCREMALALEASVRPATASEVSRWVEEVAGAGLRDRAAVLAQIESHVLDAVPSSTGAEAAQQLEPPSVPLSTPTPEVASAPVPKSRARLLLGATAAVAGATGIAFFTTLYVVAPKPAPGPTALATSASANAPPEPPASVDVPAATETAPGQHASASLPVRGRGQPVRGGGTRPLVSAKPARADDTRCRTLDAQGIWHVKPECL